MVVYVGSKGSILCFVDSKIVGSVPVTKTKSINYYKYIAEGILLESLREGKWTIHSAALHSLEIMKQRRYCSRKYLSVEENEYIIFVGFILHKLKLWDFDDGSHGLFIAPRKKPRLKH